MSATHSRRTAKRKLAELGICSAVVVVGSSTIAIDLAAFDAMHARLLATYETYVAGFHETPGFAGSVQHMCDPYGCPTHPRGELTGLGD